PIVPVASHMEVFARGRQDFQTQKRAPALIAATAREPFLYPAPTRVCGVTDRPVYYSDQLRNCVYNCDYCFLQGMHPSGHTMVFVNSEDVHAAARRIESPFWLSVSYLTDIVAFEETLPLVGQWLDVARTTPQMTLEIRTKGEAASIVRDEPVANAVLIWTLSPPLVADRYERGCASFQNRLRAARTAVDRGWRVRIAVDPVIITPGWREAYASMLDETFARLPAASVEAATYGVFRMGPDFMSRIAAARADSPILHHPFERTKALVTYHAGEIDAVREVVGTRLHDALGPDAVTFVHG
ncbi:MAG: radical SAM protein, partial [Spirochaetota bacterium]